MKEKQPQLEERDVLTCEECGHRIIICQKVPKYLASDYHLNFQGVPENAYSLFYGSRGTCPVPVCSGRWYRVDPDMIHIQGKGWVLCG